MWAEFGGGSGGIYGTDRENKKGKKGFFQRGKEAKCGVLQEYEGQCRPLELGQQIGFTQVKALRDFKENGFAGERHSLKAPQQFSPQLACQEFHRGANSGSTWGWLVLEGVKNSKNRYLE